MSELFEAPTGAWTRLDPRYPKMKRVQIIIVWPLIFAVIGVGAYLITKSWLPALITLAVSIPWIAWQIERQGRLYQRWGYTETETDIYITNGLMWRQLTIVPYGRMQLVRVNSSPVQRMFGLASVELVTASPSTSASVPGLDQATANALRDRLVTRGNLQQVGL